MITAAQELHSFIPPHLSDADGRHNGTGIPGLENLPEMEFTDKFARDGVRADGESLPDGVSSEKTGVTHITDCWHAQGHPHVCL